VSIQPEFFPKITSQISLCSRYQLQNIAIRARTTEKVFQHRIHFWRFCFLPCGIFFCGKQVPKVFYRYPGKGIVERLHGKLICPAYISPPPRPYDNIARWQLVNRVVARSVGVEPYKAPHFIHEIRQKLTGLKLLWFDAFYVDLWGIIVVEHCISYKSRLPLFSHGKLVCQY
jgi:hypothetical protein